MECHKQASTLFQEKIIQILNEEIEPINQEKNFSSYNSTDSIDFKDLLIDFSKYYSYVDVFIRSRIYPSKNLPYFIINNKNYKVLKCHAEKKNNSTKL